MNFEPQTYEELIRMKRCVELTKYYDCLLYTSPSPRD